MVYGWDEKDASIVVFEEANRHHRHLLHDERRTRTSIDPLTIQHVHIFFHPCFVRVRQT